MSTLLRLERCLLPPPETVRWDNGALKIESYKTTEKVAYCVKNFFLFTALLLTAPITLAIDFFKKKPAVPIQKRADIAPTPQWPPAQRGFATSLFQTSGLGTKWSAPTLVGKCDWDKWMDNRAHIIQSPNFDYKNFFTDVLSNPTPYIEMLKAHNVTAHRFSLEWSVIETYPDVINEKAVELYRNFIQTLIKEGITPSITLNHFVVPEWFYEAGNFQKIENINHYLRFSLKAMELFPEVKDWWSFNELGVKAFQQTREVYPTDLPEGALLSTRVHAAGIATRNMLIAHCKLHEAVAKKHPDKKLGVTHQWLKFDTANGNWLERSMAYIFTKFAFTPVYQFFKEGRFSFEIPFMANIQFEIPPETFKANHQFLMRLGVQAYPKPMVKMGLNHGETYPGLPASIKNLPLFSFGSSCEPGGTVMRFGPRWKAEGMDEILDDAFDLTDQVYITEYGSDAKVQKWGDPTFTLDDQAQKQYLQLLTERIRDYSLRTFREIKGIFCWSDLRQQMEWENGFDCKLGVIEQKRHPVIRCLNGWNQTAAAQYIASVFKKESTAESKTA